MDITAYKPMETARTFTVHRLSGGKFRLTESTVVIEKELPLYVNGEHLATASLVPFMEKEFVVGYLFGQGFIDTVQEIAKIDIVEKGAIVQLVRSNQSPGRTTKTSYRIVSGGGRAAYFESGVPSPIESPLTVTKKDIFRAMNALFENASLYRETEGVHSAALYDEKTNPLCIVEDIGRHNTLDKLIGYALLNDIDRAGTFLVSTGRMASEMVAKICRSGIPLVATKTAITDKALEMAEECGLTVIGFVRDAGSKMHTNMELRVFTERSMKIYTGARRVL